MTNKIEFSGKYNGNAIVIVTDGRGTSGSNVIFYPDSAAIQSIELVQRNTAQPFGIKINLDPAGDFEEYKGDYGVVMPDEASSENPFMVLPYLKENGARGVMEQIADQMRDCEVEPSKAPIHRM